jgi:hypothetical protein
LLPPKIETPTQKEERHGTTPNSIVSMTKSTMDGNNDGNNEVFIPAHRVSSIMEASAHIATRGTKSTRILATASGMGLLLTSCSIFVIHTHDTQYYTTPPVLEILNSFLALLTGIMALILETNLSVCNDRQFRNVLIIKFPVLIKAAFRGLLYYFVGQTLLIIFAFWPVYHVLHGIVGLFTLCVGIYMIRIGTRASKLSATIRKSITDETSVLTAFANNDKNGDGHLEMFEFEGLMLELGIELDADELTSTFNIIDTNNDKKIVYDEFRTWWRIFIADVNLDWNSAGVVV